MPPWLGTGNYAKNIRRTTFRTWVSIFVTLTPSLSIFLFHSHSLSWRYLIFDTSDDDSICPMSNAAAYFTGKRHGLAYGNGSIIRRATGFSAHSIALSLSRSFVVSADANSHSPPPTLFSTERPCDLHNIFPRRWLTWWHVSDREQNTNNLDRQKKLRKTRLIYKWIGICDCI